MLCWCAKPSARTFALSRSPLKDMTGLNDKEPRYSIMVAVQSRDVAVCGE